MHSPRFSLSDFFARPNRSRSFNEQFYIFSSSIFSIIIALQPKTRVWRPSAVNNTPSINRILLRIFPTAQDWAMCSEHDRLLFPRTYRLLNSRVMMANRLWKKSDWVHIYIYKYCIRSLTSVWQSTLLIFLDRSPHQLPPRVFHSLIYWAACCRWAKVALAHVGQLTSYS